MTESSRVEDALKWPRFHLEDCPKGKGVCICAQVAHERLAAEVLSLREVNAQLTQDAMGLRERLADIERRFPAGMEGRSILFKECEKGHGWLTATNWVQHGCPTCRAEAAESRCADLMEQARLREIDCSSLESRLSSLTAPVNGERLQRALEWAENRCSPHLLAEELARALRQSRAAAEELRLNMTHRYEIVEKERDLALRERDLARAHDSQPYPTAEAYERVCIVAAGAKARVEELCASLYQARENDGRHIAQRDTALSRLASAEKDAWCKAARKVEDICAEFGDDPRACLGILGEHFAAYDAQTGEGA